MEKIILNAMLTACREESSLWEIFLEIDMLFPEQTKGENFVIAKESTIWMYDTGKITFYLGNEEEARDFELDKLFLSQDENWSIDSRNAHTIFSMLTDSGDLFCNNFMGSYTSDLKKVGLIRKGIKYNIRSNVFTKHEKSGYLFWVSSLVALLGTPQMPIAPSLIKHISDCGERFCIVDTRTKTVVDLSLPSNFA